MPRSVVEYRCLIISPGDVVEERVTIVEVIQRWNASVGAYLGIRVEPVRWETHTHPDLSGPAQAKVNEQIVDECDFGIAVFWSRVGTPTEEYDSGSVEEVERLSGRGAKVMFYRSSRPIPPEKLDTHQYDRLTELTHQYRERGLLGQFADINELRLMVNKDLSLLLGKKKTQDIVAATAKQKSKKTIKLQPDKEIETKQKQNLDDQLNRSIFIHILKLRGLNRVASAKNIAAKMNQDAGIVLAHLNKLGNDQCVAYQTGGLPPTLDTDFFLSPKAYEIINIDESQSVPLEGQDTRSSIPNLYAEYGVFWDDKFNMRCLSCMKPLKNSSLGPSIFFCSDPKCNSKHILKDNLGNAITKQEAINKIKGSA